MSDNIEVSRHAKKRMKGRGGIPKRAQLRQAKLALERGYRHKDTVGKLNSFLTEIYLSRENANNMRIYGNKIYLFHGTILVTVLNLPNEYFKNLERYIKKEATEGRTKTTKRLNTTYNIFKTIK